MPPKHTYVVKWRTCDGHDPCGRNDYSYHKEEYLTPERALDFLDKLYQTVRQYRVDSISVLERRVTTKVRMKDGRKVTSTTTTDTELTPADLKAKRPK